MFANLMNCWLTRPLTAEALLGEEKPLSPSAKEKAVQRICRALAKRQAAAGQGAQA